MHRPWTEHRKNGAARMTWNRRVESDRFQGTRITASWSPLMKTTTEARRATPAFPSSRRMTSQMRGLCPLKTRRCSRNRFNRGLQWAPRDRKSCTCRLITVLTTRQSPARRPSGILAAVRAIWSVGDKSQKNIKNYNYITLCNNYVYHKNMKKHIREIAFLNRHMPLIIASKIRTHFRC